MINKAPKRPPAAAKSPILSWSDDRLVSECLRGNERAWAALIDKYKNLIFSIPIKYGATREDAADLFQAVCLELFSELPHLRKAGSLRSWLITVAMHKSFHWKKKQRRRAEKEISDANQEELCERAAETVDLVERLEREQMVREAVARLPARCGEMIRLLFYEHPPVPYSELAQRLGLATGSIGFIRGRCLKRLQKFLEDDGF
jgi:RNA polymerase sigma factor (sigma-70 family)